MEEILYEVSRDYESNIYYNVGRNESQLHFHQQLELLHINEGSYEVIINNTTQVLNKGDIAIADSFDNHKFTPITEDANSTVLIIPVQFLKKYSSLMNNKSLKEHYITDENQQKCIYECIENVYNASSTNDLILEGYILILLGKIIEDNVLDNKDKADYDLIKKILIYIEDNYPNQITLETIAKYFGYSKYYFSHLFNKCFKCNLNDYINLVRCRHTVNLVLNDHLSVTEAAYKSGFISMRTFYRTFQKFFKMTPKEYFNSRKR